MQFLFEYLAKLSFSLGAVYLFYLLLLRRLTFYNCNRCYLLFYTSICFYLPFIDISNLLGWCKMGNNKVFNTISSLNLFSVSNIADTSGTTDQLFTNRVNKMIGFLLISGAVVLLLRLAIQYISFFFS